MLVIRLQVVLEVDNESGCDGGEQTGLPPRKVRITIEVNTRERKDAHEDQAGVQVFIVFLHEVAVVLVGFSLKLVVEFDAGADSERDGNALSIASFRLEGEGTRQ